MNEKILNEIISIPQDIKATIAENGFLMISGPKGEVTKSFLHPLIALVSTDDSLEFVAKKNSLVAKKLIKTYVAHVNNLFKGVTQGHEYELKICSGHFPMNVSLKGDVFEIKNFIGEAVPRKLIIKEGSKVTINGDIITVTGINKELVSQTAASIEKLTRRNGFDRRIFQDGIYITKKDGKEL
jgi:large subunit ribosomal protein L6